MTEHEDLAETFEDKYEHHFTELQRAYRQAFEAMADRHDSELIHAIDQRVLAESEPFYDEGSFRVELPPDPADRLPGVDPDRLDTVLERYVEELEAQLRAVFGVGKEHS